MKRQLIKDASEAEQDEVKSRLIAFNRTKFENLDYHEYVLRHDDDQGNLVGGMTFSIHGQWIDIDFLFVEEAARGRGIGRQLMAEAEELARGQGCRMASLETFAFQARPFYEKLGYRVVHEKKNYPVSGYKFSLEKEL